MNKINKEWMRIALKEAEIAFESKEIPIGAIIIKNNKIISKAHNQVELLKDSTAHAEILAITSASSRLDNWRLSECDMYVTLEPCAMCAGAIVKSRLRNIFFGCYNKYEGCVSSVYNLCNEPKFNHQSGIKGGILEEECSDLLNAFFKHIV